MNIRMLGIVATAGVLIGVAGAGAQVTYNFTDSKASGGGSAGAPDSQPANGTATSLTLGAGLTALNRVGSHDYGFEGVAGPGTTLDTANNDYVQFTVDANNGFQATWTNLSFASGRALNGWRRMAVRSSLNNFTTDIQTFQRDDNGNVLTHSTPLSGFSNLQNPVTFRIYGYDAESPLGDSFIDQIVLSGSITSAVPEPTSMAVLGLGAMGLIRRRRA